MRKQETITISEAEIREAILEWYQSKGGAMDGAIALRLICKKSSYGHGWDEADVETYSATITRVLFETDK